MKCDKQPHSYYWRAYWAAHVTWPPLRLSRRKKKFSGLTSHSSSRSALVQRWITLSFPFSHSPQFPFPLLFPLPQQSRAEIRLCGGKWWFNYASNLTDGLSAVNIRARGRNR